MIQLVEIRKIFNHGKPNEFTALDGVSIALNQKGMIALTGPSGSGKTTLLSIIAGMSRPTSGRIYLGGKEMTSLPERFLTDIRRAKFGVIFQQFNLIRGLTSLENIMIPAFPNGEKYNKLKERAEKLLDMMSLIKKAHSKIEWLSGGEAQRTAIARALINDPQIIIADEPTAHLDSALSREFMNIMGQLKDAGKTILIASHDPLIFEASGIDQVIGMRDGKIVAKDNDQA